MTKSQHTQGPWKADTNCAVEGITVKLSNGREFYVSSEGQEYNEVAANARLIAAAPELLAACIEATSLFDNYPQCYEAIGTLEVLNSAIKATQKAKGE